MAFNQPQTQPSWTAFNLNSLVLWGKRWNPDDPKSCPRLYPYVSEDGSLCFGVYYNDGKLRDAIRWKFDAVTANVIFEIIKKVVNSPIGTNIKRKLDRTSMFSHKGKISDKPTIVLTLLIGKTDDGVVYIGLQPVGEKLVVFPFNEGLPIGITISESNNEKVTASELSEYRALAWSHLVREFYTNHLFFKQKEPPKKETSGNSGGYRAPTGGDSSDTLFSDDVSDFL